MNSNNTGPTTVRQSYRLLRQVMEAAVNDERINRNPCAGIKLPKITPAKKRGLTREELLALAAECGDYSPLILFLGMTGLRINEALALRVGDINPATLTVDVHKSWTTDVSGRRILGDTKTRKERKVPVPAPVLEALAPFMKDKQSEDWLFIGASGDALQADWLRKRIFNPAKARLGMVDINIHSLRHTCASLLIKLSAPITTVSYIMGQASVKMTLDIYGHYYKDDTSERVSILGDFILSER